MDEIACIVCVIFRIKKKEKRKKERYIILQLFESISLMIPPLLNRLPHTRLPNPLQWEKEIRGRMFSPRGRDRFRRKKRGLDAAAKRCCTMVGGGRDKRVLRKDEGTRRERKGKGRSVSNCERVSSSCARLSSVENG